MNYIGHKSSRIGERCSIPSLVRFHYSPTFGACVGTQTGAMDGPTGKDRRAMDRGMDAIGMEARINSTDATRQGGSRPSAPAATIGHSIGAALHILLVSPPEARPHSFIAHRALWSGTRRESCGGCFINVAGGRT